VLSAIVQVAAVAASKKAGENSWRCSVQSDLPRGRTLQRGDPGDIGRSTHRTRAPGTAVCCRSSSTICRGVTSSMRAEGRHDQTVGQHRLGQPFDVVGQHVVAPLDRAQARLPWNRARLPRGLAPGRCRWSRVLVDQVDDIAFDQVVDIDGSEGPAGPRSVRRR
jgi:hypothetical protein